MKPKLKYKIIVKDGHRYVKIGKKTIRVSSGISERELIKFIINKLHHKRKPGKPSEAKAPVKPNTSSISNQPGINRIQDKFDDLKKDVEKAKASSMQRIAPSFTIPKPALPPAPTYKDQIVIFDNKGDAKSALSNEEFEYLKKDILQKTAASAKQKAEEKAKQEKDVLKQDAATKAISEKERLSNLANDKVKKVQKEAELENQIKKATEKGKKDFVDYDKKIQQHFSEYVKDFLIKLPKGVNARTTKKPDMIEYITKAGLYHNEQYYIDKQLESEDIKKTKSEIATLETTISQLEQTPHKQPVEIIVDTGMRKELDKEKTLVPDEEKSDEPAAAAADATPFKFSPRDLLDEFGDPLNAGEEVTGKGKNVSRDGMTNFEIDDVMSPYGSKYLGCVAHDQIESLILPKVTNTEFGFIFNLDNHTEVGSHWVAIYCDPVHKKEIDYFDSFGRQPDERTLHSIKLIAEKINCNTYLKLKWNRIILQKNSSSNCGWFACSFLISMYSGKKWVDASGWNDAINGERDIERFKSQHGAGVFDFIGSFGRKIGEVAKEAYSRVKTAITGRTSMPSVVKNLVDKYGTEKVTDIQIARTPVNSVITGVLNALSGDTIDQNMKKLNYDNIYHLYMIVTLESGYKFKIERNESISVSSGDVSSNSEVINVPIKPVSLSDLIEKGSSGNSSFWTYSSTNNCQRFVADLLSKNGMMTTELKNFILQDANELLSDSPLVQKIADTVPDIFDRLKILAFGAGKKKRKRKIH